MLFLWPRFVSNARIGNVRIHGVPIGYFLRGYSLPISVVGNILEDFLQYCHRQGIHIPVSCFDGQFMKLVQTWDGHPQTILELQKQFWNMVCRLPKARITAELKACNQADISVVSNPNTNRNDAQRAILSSYSVNLPQTAQKFLRHKEIRNKEEMGKSATKQSLDIAQDLEDIQLELLSINVSTNNQVVQLQDLTSRQNNEDNDNHPASVIPTNESEAKPALVLSNEDLEELKDDLSKNYDKWRSRSVEDLKGYFVSCREMSKMNGKELSSIMKFLRDRKLLKVKISGSKQRLLEELKSLLHISGDVPSQKFRRRSPAKLKDLCLRCLQQKSYSKMALNVSYANWKFGEVLDNWRQGAKIKHNMVVQGLSKPVEWFYVPEWHSDRKQLETKKIDPHHLLTRHRSALCKGNLGSAQRSEFIKVAGQGNTQLKLGMIEDRINMQSTDFSLITFSVEVENELRAIKAHKSAEMCKMIRDWFEACDQPGIPALERCRNMWRYREKLLSFVDLQRFSPPGMHIRGYPKQLWEATIASIDVDLQLYSLTKRRTYNQRAVSSQNCEAIYSSLAALPGSNNGVPTCIGLETNMAKLCGESLVRLDPNRGFPLRMSSAPVYPQQTLEKVNNPLPAARPPPSFIDDIKIVDHPFDDRSRRRTARHHLHGLSNIHEPAKGVSRVRQHHKVDESRINPLVRMGKAKDTAF